MAKDMKPRRPRAETPKGFRDYFGAEVTERKAMLDRIAAVYHRHGFDALETSGVETVEALGKFLPDVDRPNAGVFAWQEEAVPGGGSGDWLARPVLQTPVFSGQAILELVVPLAITVLVVQNGQGVAVLRSAGHTAPVNTVTIACGTWSVLTCP